MHPGPLECRGAGPGHIAGQIEGEGLRVLRFKVWSVRCLWCRRVVDLAHVHMFSME